MPPKSSSEKKSQFGGLTNFYDGMDKKYADQGLDYPNKDTINISLPFRAIFVGPSGSGKTTTLINLIKAINKFDKIYLIARELDEPLYRYFKDVCAKVSKQIKREFLVCSNSLADVPLVDETPKVHTVNGKQVPFSTLVILDDWINTPPKELKTVVDIFIRGRKRNMSVAWLSQNYYGIPLKLRQNSSYIFLKKISGTRDLTAILRDTGAEYTKEQLVSMYTQATSGDFLNFLLIDLKTMDPRLKYRKNFG